MPVDLSKPHSDRRKVNRDAAGLRQDGMYSREIEMKRNRGEISCAECRRCVIGHPTTRTLLALLSVELPSHVVLDLKLSATSRSHASHVRYVFSYFFLPRGPPRHIDTSFLEERVCLFMSEWSVSHPYCISLLTMLILAPSTLVYR